MQNHPEFPYLGFGLGLRTEHYANILNRWPKSVDWFEIISENFIDSHAKPKRVISEIKEHYPIVMHGVSLSIGSTDPLDFEYLKKLKSLANYVKPEWLSDHLCWTGINKENTHDLLPTPYTQESLKHIVKRIKIAQDFLERRILLENPSTYLEFADSHIDEAEFLYHIVKESGCAMLLDINNVYVASYNHSYNPIEYLDKLPHNDIYQIHLAGHQNNGSHIIDTHDNYVIDKVWQLYAYYTQKYGKKSTMIEWDDNIPSFKILCNELNKAKKISTTPQNYLNDTVTKALTNSPTNTSPKKNTEKYQKLLEKLHHNIIPTYNLQKNSYDWIKKKKTLSNKAQLEIYANAYKFRLFDLIYDDYPIFYQFAGEDLAEELISKYINTHISEHPNISKYSEEFSNFLTNTANNHLAEIAIFESISEKLFDKKDSTEILDQEALKQYDINKLLTLKIKLKQAAKIIQFNYPINQYVAHYKQNSEEHITIKKHNCYLALFRHNEIVRYIEINEFEYQFLELANGQNNIESIIDKLQSTYPTLSETKLQKKLQSGLSKAIKHKLLTVR